MQIVVSWKNGGTKNGIWGRIVTIKSTYLYLKMSITITYLQVGPRQ